MYVCMYVRVLQHAMKAVMKEEEQYSAFTDLCCDIYNILRENSALLVGTLTLTFLRTPTTLTYFFLPVYTYCITWKKPQNK